MTRLPRKPVPLRLHAGLCCVFLVPALARAATMPVARIATAAICHDSIQAAAVAGLQAAAASSIRVEYGGVVFQRDAHCFVHSIPVTSNQPSRLDYVVNLERGGMPLVGIFHTHTPGRYAGSFSDDDIATQKRLGVPSYLGVLGNQGRSLTIRCLTGAQVGAVSCAPLPARSGSLSSPSP